MGLGAQVSWSDHSVAGKLHPHWQEKRWRGLWPRLSEEGILSPLL